ncbi:MAG: hypothetical protein V1899_02805 [Planctomycetota bacterium]
MYHPHHRDHGYYQSWRSVHNRKQAAHNRDLAIMLIVLVVIVVLAALYLAPDVPWLDVFGKVAARGLQELAK